MHDIGARITQMVGGDYMKNLEQITGNIMFVDPQVFTHNIEKINKCQTNIKISLDNLYKESPNDCVKSLISEFARNKIDFSSDKLYVKKVKKNKTIKRININYRALTLYKTPWFETIKTIEKNINKGMRKIFPEEREEKVMDNKTFTDVQNIFREHPNLKSIYTIFDVELTSKSIYDILRLIKRYCGIIINIIMNPWYDVKARINSKQHMLKLIFKRVSNLSEEPYPLDMIVSTLTSFIIIKYRVKITGQDNHYIKFFVDLYDDDFMTEMNPARFIEVIDTLNIENLRDNGSTYDFAMKTKDLISKAINGENVNLTEVESAFMSILGDTATNTTEASSQGVAMAVDDLMADSN